MASIRGSLNLLKQKNLFKDNLWEIRWKDFDDITFLAQETNIPFRKFEVDYDKVLQKQYYKNYTEPTDISISIIETEGLVVTQFINEWISSFMTDDGRFKAGVDPRKDFTVTFQKFNKLTLLNYIKNLTALAIPPQVNIPESVSRTTTQGVSAISTTLSNVVDPLEDTVSFKVVGARFLEREDFTLKYDGGDLTIIKLDMKADNIIPDTTGGATDTTAFSSANISSF